MSVAALLRAIALEVGAFADSLSDEEIERAFVETEALERRLLLLAADAEAGASPEKPIARSYLKLRNWRPPFAEHRNLRWNHRNKRPLAERRCAKCGPIVCWTHFPNCSRNTVFRLLWPSSWESARQGRAFRLASRCPPLCKVMSLIW